MLEHPFEIWKSKQIGRPSLATILPCSFFLEVLAEPSHSFAPSHLANGYLWRPRQATQTPPRGAAPD